jgi:hypothetical protein
MSALGLAKEENNKTISMNAKNKAMGISMYESTVYSFN